MKKILAFLVCAVLLCSVVALNAGAETKNLCETFEKEINTLHLCINNHLNVTTSQSFEAESIMTYLDVKIGNEKYKEMGDKGFCLVDADVVEARAKAHFLNVDIEALRKTTNPFTDDLTGDGFEMHRYSETAKKYVIMQSGFGAPSRYVIIGYKVNGNMYDVYSAYISFEEDNTIPGGAVLDKDYVVYDGKNYLVQYAVKTTVAYKNDTIQFCAWEYNIANIPDTKTLITPKTDLNATSSSTSSAATSSAAASSNVTSTTSKEESKVAVYAETEGLTLSGEKNLFASGTSVKAEKVTEGEIFTRVKNALPDDTGRYTVFEITAKKGETAVQPKGKITAEFKVPNSYDIDRVVLLYVSEDGKIETVKSTTDYVNGTIKAELEHFSTYVLAEGGHTLDTDGTAAKGSRTIAWIIVGVAAFVLIAAGVAFYFLYLNYNKASKK